MIELGRLPSVGFCFLCLLWLTACSLPSYQELSNVNDLCAILQEKPSWAKGLNRAERSKTDWPVKAHIVMAFIYRESAYLYNARPEEETADTEAEAQGAWGYAQAKRSTWDDYLSATGRGKLSREDFDAAVDFISWYNWMSHIELNIATEAADKLYLAYHEGRAGYDQGSHRSKEKSWLQSASKDVERRAKMYKKQYKTCRGKPMPRHMPHPLH